MILLCFLFYHDTGIFPVTQVDRLERNHLVNEETGKTIFTQVIAWREYGDAGEHVSWFVIDNGQVNILPSRGSWLATFWQEDNIRIYRANRYDETYSFNDPEMDDRQFLRKEERR